MERITTANVKEGDVVGMKGATIPITVKKVEPDGITVAVQHKWMNCPEENKLSNERFDNMLYYRFSR